VHILKQTCLFCKTFQAFIKLESMPTIPEEERGKYADLGMSIFMKREYSPIDPYALRETRDKMKEKAMSK